MVRFSETLLFAADLSGGVVIYNFEHAEPQPAGNFGTASVNDTGFVD
jgi:hypothetical protein